MVALSVALPASLQSLFIYDGKIRDIGIQVLSNIFSDISSLTAVTLSQGCLRRLSTSAIQMLGHAIPQLLSLKSLSLEAWDISLTIYAALAAKLPFFSCLYSLVGFSHYSFSGQHNIGSKSCHTSAYFAFSHFFVYRHFFEPSFSDIACSLSSLPALISLHLHICGDLEFSHNEDSALAVSLSSLVHLTVLDFRYTLLSAWTHFPSLRELRIRCVYMTVSGLALVAAALDYVPDFTVLDLSKNHLADTVCLYLAAILLRFRPLQSIMLATQKSLVCPLSSLFSPPV